MWLPWYYSSGGRALFLDCRVSWVHVPPTAALFSSEKSVFFGITVVLGVVDWFAFHLHTPHLYNYDSLPPCVSLSSYIVDCEASGSAGNDSHLSTRQDQQHHPDTGTQTGRNDRTTPPQERSILLGPVVNPRHACTLCSGGLILQYLVCICLSVAILALHATRQPFVFT